MLLWPPWIHRIYLMGQAGAPRDPVSLALLLFVCEKSIYSKQQQWLRETAVKADWKIVLSPGWLFVVGRFLLCVTINAHTRDGGHNLTPLFSYIWTPLKVVKPKRFELSLWFGTLRKHINLQHYMCQEAMSLSKRFAWEMWQLTPHIYSAEYGIYL